MRTPHGPAVAPSPMRARVAISTQFFTNGVLCASLLPRLPEIKRAFELSDTAYGFVVIAFALGSILAANAAAPLIRRFGALQVAVGGTVLLAAALAGAGLSGAVVPFVVFMMLGGVFDALLDSGQNVHGLAVERWHGRSIINSLHASWSVGATVGGVIGATCAAFGVPIGTQMVVGAVVWAVVAVVAGFEGAVPAEHLRRVESAADDGSAAADGAATATRRRFPWKLLAPLVVLAICGTLVEDVANNWVTLYLNRDVGAPIGLAGLGFAAMLGAQFVGRLLGDPMTDRWGRAAVARSGGVLILLGSLTAVLAPHPLIAITGFAIAGFGSATLVPAAYAAADNLPGIAHGSGVAMLGWLMRFGFLLTSPMIGIIADGVGLRLAMLVPALAGLVAAVIAHLVGWRERAGRPARA